MPIRNGNVIYISMDAHPTAMAIVVKYEVSCANKLNKDFQKIIYLKELNEDADSLVIAQFVLEACPVIPALQIVELEQIIFYLQKRSRKHTVLNEKLKTLAKAKLDNVECYIEMLYEESEKLKAIKFLLNLSFTPSNLSSLIENEVLIGALTRLFREDSKKNFELATNIINFFFQFSKYLEFHSTLSRFKIGNLTMQLIEQELKRYELWHEQQKELMNEKNQQKWNFAIQKQNQLLTVCLSLLLNLAADLKVEYKMVKRGVLTTLLKCFTHVQNVSLLTVATNFLWKLSIFTENRLIMNSIGIIDKCVNLFPNKSLDLSNAIFALLFNLSFESNLCNQMVDAGLINFVAPFIQNSFVALSLFYQLSIAQDAKTIIGFTDMISVLMRMLFDDRSPLEYLNVIKAILINAVVEKRNAQIICSADGQGLDSIMSFAFENNDLMMLKVAHNVSLHSGSMHEMFFKWVPQLMENAISKINLTNEKNLQDHLFGMECMRISTNIISAPWIQINKNLNVIKYIENCLNTAHNSDKIEKTINNNVEKAILINDDATLQIIILCGTLSLHVELAEKISKFMPHFHFFLIKKQEDDEFVLQIVNVYLCLLLHSNLAQKLSADDSLVVEYLIKLMHDKNQKLKLVCEQALHIIVKTNKYWTIRVSEERFRWYNIHWLEMVTETNGLIENFESLDHFNSLILDAHDILEIKNFH